MQGAITHLKALQQPSAQDADINIDPLKLKPAVHWKRLITVGSLGEWRKGLERSKRNDVNRVLGLRPLRCRISSDIDTSLPSQKYFLEYVEIDATGYLV